jgi:signal transduction histidine kinase
MKSVGASASGSIARLALKFRSQIRGLVFAVVALVAAADYLTGYEISFSVFYLLAISLATWFIGTRFGVIISILSVACWLAGDVAAGANYSSRFVPAWNAAILLLFYSVVIVVLSNLRSLHQNLETKVSERTHALTLEMAKRERLERELLAVSEREQRRIGQDLHDSLCQHLLGAALAGQVLSGKLQKKSLAEAQDASDVVGLIEEGIELARSLARGLAPVEFEEEALMTALREFAKTTTARLGLECKIFIPHPVFIKDSMVAMHLFRIAQEAVSNAAKHGRARCIRLSLIQESGQTDLTVTDDGCGLPDPPIESRGMGLQIMKHRAAMIGASIDIVGTPSGTTVRCRRIEPTPEDEK